ncbi:MAG TPA: serpin family protein [Streptosporangiaceae bacterium]|nr:serpin family protein [Streptosporangiaceae bacterium]
MTAVDTFGTDLYRLLADGHPDLVFSPLSVSAALRLAWYGARGETRDELTRALHPTAGARMPDLATSGSVTFRMANTAWVQRGLRLESDYARQLGGEAMTTLADADFTGAPGLAREKINATVAEQTEQKIRDLLGPGDIDSRTRLVLANAVYLKARWSSPFPEHATSDAPFFPGDGTELKVPMMRGCASRAYKRGDGYQAVLLPYEASPLAMAIILPDGPLAGDPVATGAFASGPIIGDLVSGTAPCLVDLRLPKFRLKTQLALVPALNSLGIRQAFTPDADFTGITTAERLHIDAVAHQAYLDVDEQGTEAAAATAVTMKTAAFVRPQTRVEMTVDRPFLFAIVDTRTTTILFLGHLSTPRGTRGDC